MKVRYIPYFEIDDFGCWIPLTLCFTFIEGKCIYKSIEDLIYSREFGKELNKSVKNIDAITCIKQPKDMGEWLSEKEHIRTLNFLGRKKCSSSYLG